ncbi:response regulator transcription factor [Amycolatopsis sp. NPDC050768]|uniref:response regulator transcription factor n=1 Tax=unclassified Amycolatopsis TaxID=2618356 RepID=UPI0033F082FA
MTLRIVLAEDHALLRESLRTVFSLAEDIDVVEAVDNGADALEAIRRERPDGAMVDIDMPRMSGLEVAEAVRAEGLDCGLLVVTSYGKPGYLHRAMRAGVRGFVTKNISPDDLITAVRKVCTGGRHVDPEIAADALAVGETPLTERELDVLRLSGAGLRPAEIGARLSLAEGTVRNYLSSALTKLQVDNRVAAYRVAEEAGWL